MIKRRAARRQAEKPDIMQTLLAEFRDAPIPASRTDWQDLQRRIEARKMAQTPRRNAARTRAKIAFAACGVLLCVAADYARLSAARNPAPRTAALALAPSQFAASPSQFAPPSLRIMTQTSKGASQTAKATPPPLKFMTQTAKRTAQTAKGVTQTAFSFSRKRTLRSTARTSVRQFASVLLKAKTAQKTAAKADAPNPEITRIAQNVDGENMAFSLMPVDYVLPTVQAAPEPQTITIYVTAEIPAPMAWAAQPETKELEAW